MSRIEKGEKMNNHHCANCGSPIIDERQYHDHLYQHPFQSYVPISPYVGHHYYPRTRQFLIEPNELIALQDKQIQTTIQNLGTITACVGKYDPARNRVSLTNIVNIHTGVNHGTMSFQPAELVGYNIVNETCPVVDLELPEGVELAMQVCLRKFQKINYNKLQF